MIYRNPTHAKFVVLVLILIGATIYTYWPVQQNGFVLYDDIMYIHENQELLKGLTPETLAWSFTSFYACNWHPLTWLSHMLDVEFFSLNAGGHHWSSLLWHLANVILLYLLISKMTGSVGRSAFVAAIFALHPLHVESVAWASERKDVLCAFFWFAAMLTYYRYTKNPSVWGYVAVIVLFLLGLMSKPMIVTLPFVLLLMDYWPLMRWREEITSDKEEVHADTGGALQRLNPFSLLPDGISRRTAIVMEKIPLIALSLFFSTVTFLAQRKGGAVQTFNAISLSDRLVNGLLSYVLYVKKMVWPLDLAVYYPYSGMPPLWIILAVMLLLASVSIAAIKYRRKHPFLLVGWFWYLGTLVPVLGIVQVGSQAMADRYTYIPMVGISIMVAWGVPLLFRHLPHRRILLVGAAFACLVVLAVLTRNQIGYWQNSITLFQRALDVTGENCVAHNNLGVALFAAGRYEQAVHHYREALRIYPNFTDAHSNMGDYFFQHRNYARAVEKYSLVVRRRPGDVKARKKIGMALWAMGRKQEAEIHLREYLRLTATDEKQRVLDWGNLLLEFGEYERARQHFEAMVRVDPRNPHAYNNLGIVLMMNKGDADQAISHFRQALYFQPDYEIAKENLAHALSIKKGMSRDRRIGNLGSKNVKAMDEWR